MPTRRLPARSSDDKLGYVLALRSGHDENYLRVLESVALDAVLLEDYVGPLTLAKPD